MKVTHQGTLRPIRNTVTIDGVVIGPTPGGGIGVIGGDGDPPDLPDVAGGGTAEIPIPAVPEATIIQSAYADVSGSTAVVVLGVTPTEGNLLIAWQVNRSTVIPLGPSGWTAHPSGYCNATATAPNYNGAFFYKFAGASESTTITGLQSGGGGGGMTVVEVSGVGALLTSGETNEQSSVNLSMSATTAAASIMFAGFVQRVADGSARSVTPLANSTEITDTMMTAGFSPLDWLGYRIEAAAGTFAVGGTSTGNNDWGGQILAFAVGSGITWTDAPLTIDGSDTTCTFVPDSETEIWRVDLGAEYNLSSARMYVGIESAGAVIYYLQAATLADFSDAVTVASTGFTATGSYTSQEVLFDWTSTGSFQYWQLVGPGENLYICSVELFQNVVGSGTDDHGELSGLSDDDHPQYLRTTLGGLDVVQAHGTLGATEVIDLANANVHWGTLDQACTLTFTGWTNLRGAAIRVELIQDGTGGWTPTFTGVTWIGGTPAWVTTAGTVTHVVLFSRDGGTTIYGVPVGTGAASFATPAIVLGTAAAAGAATTVIRSDSTILAFDATVPTTQAFGDAAATGSAAVAARRDHRHGMPSAVSNQVVMASGSIPPDPVLNSAGDDWVYS